jgi:hypothetical protein
MNDSSSGLSLFLIKILHRSAYVIADPFVFQVAIQKFKDQDI